MNATFWAIFLAFFLGQAHFFLSVTPKTLGKRWWWTAILYLAAVLCLAGLMTLAGIPLWSTR